MFQNLHRSVQEGFVDVLETQQNFTRQNEAYFQGLKEYGAPPDISQEVLGQGSLNRLATATQSFDPYTQQNQQTVTDAAVSAVILANASPGQVNSVSGQEAARCRRLTGLSGIEQMIRENSANPTKPFRCGVRYKPSGGIVPAVAQGAYGGSKGPLLTTPADALGNGVQWIWDLEEARKTLLRDSAKNMGGSCDTLNLLPFLQNGTFQNKLGYCTTSRKFIPIENGKARYPRDTALNCAQQNIVTNPGNCPPSRTPGSIPGRPTSPGAVNLRNCSASGVGLTRDCLLMAVKTAGCSDKGTLYTSLQKAPASAPQVDGDLNLKRSFRDYQMEQSSAALSPNLFQQGRATMSVALADVGRLQTAANTGRTAKIKNAAFDLCYKAGEYDKYNFCGDLVDTALLTTVDLTCIQQYWQSKGGKPAGRAYPRTAGAPIPALGNPRTWGDFKRAIDAMVAALQSNDTNAQRTAYLEFLGIELGSNPYVDFSFPRWNSDMLTLVDTVLNQGTQIELLLNKTNTRGAVYYNKKVSIGAFQTQFQFSIQGDRNSDGLCFVIQNDGPTAIGAIGGWNGFAGLQKAVCVMFDYWPGSSVGIYTGPQFTTASLPQTHEFSSPSIDFKSGNRFSVDIHYKDSILSVKILNMDTGGTAFFQKEVNIFTTIGVDTAWVGFTSGAGSMSSRPVVHSWSFSSGVLPQGSGMGFPFTNGQKVYLKTVFNTYAIALHDNRFAQAPHAKEWETFTLEQVTPNQFRFKDFHGKYIIAFATGGVTTESRNPGAWEVFTIVPQGDGTYALKTYHNTYLRADPGGGWNQQTFVGPYEKLTIGEIKPWTCLPGIPMPVRLGIDEEVECMSGDARNCAWQGSDAACSRLLSNPVYPNHSLKCGAMSKSIYGITGYDTPGHWCARAKQQLS